MTINLNDIRNLKQAEKTYQELKEIESKLTTCIETIAPYSKYIYIMECLSILHNSRTLLEIKTAKYEKLNEKK